MARGDLTSASVFKTSAGLLGYSLAMPLSASLAKRVACSGVMAVAGLAGFSSCSLAATDNKSRKVSIERSGKVSFSGNIPMAKHTVDEHFVGKPAEVRNIYDKLV